MRDRTSYASDSWITLSFYRVYCVVHVSHVTAGFPSINTDFLPLANACVKFWYSLCSSGFLLQGLPYSWYFGLLTAGVLVRTSGTCCSALVYEADRQANVASLPGTSVSLKDFWEEHHIKVGWVMEWIAEYSTTFYPWVWKRSGYPLQYSCLRNPMDRGTWWAAVHGVARSWTRLSD